VYSENDTKTTVEVSNYYKFTKTGTETIHTDWNKTTNNA